MTNMAHRCRPPTHISSVRTRLKLVWGGEGKMWGVQGGWGWGWGGTHVLHGLFVHMCVWGEERAHQV